MHVMIEFGRKIYQECLKEIEENIRQSEFRKKNYYVEHKADRRTLLTTFGNLEIELEEEIPVQKKKIKNLHIQADEDHVALQFSKKKGELPRKFNEHGWRTMTTLII